MLSRVAENLYWLARYIERVENTARLINVNTNLMLDLPKIAQPGWVPIIDILGSGESYHENYSDDDERSVLKFLISDTQNYGSIQNSLMMARENCRTIRDIIPREGWELVNDIFFFAKDQSSKGISKKGRYEFIKKLIGSTQGLTGMLAGTMLHDEGYDFLKMGRNLERADMTTRIIDVRTANLLGEAHEGLTPFETIQWMSVLKSLTGYQMYRRTIQVRVSRAGVLTFLMQEKSFPRSFYHTLCEVESCLKNMMHNKEALAEVNTLQNLVLETDFSTLAQAQLHEFIDDLQFGLAQVHNMIVKSYFLHL